MKLASIILSVVLVSQVSMKVQLGVQVKDARALLVECGRHTTGCEGKICSCCYSTKWPTTTWNDLRASKAPYRAWPKQRSQYRVGSDTSSRPFIFVIHNLGGLVCKEVILFTRNNPEAHLRDVFGHTMAIVFMGIPHKGVWMVDWVKISVSVLGIVKSTNKSLLKVLEMDDWFLESIQVGF